jgi:hypothetical protein
MFSTDPWYWTSFFSLLDKVKEEYEEEIPGDYNAE